MVVIAEGGVVVALGSGGGGVGGGRGGGVRPPGALLHDVVVLLAVERAAVPQRELVPRHQLPRARAAPEALDVVDFAFRAHHKIVFAERRPALVALRAKQPATNTVFII